MTREDRELLRRLRRLRKRIKNFCGVLWDRDRRKYRSAIKAGGRVRILGWHDSELDAFRSYSKANAALHPRDRISPFEAPARVERLLALAARCPISVRPEPVLSSSLDLSRNDLWQEAGGFRIKAPAAAHQAQGES